MNGLPHMDDAAPLEKTLDLTVSRALQKAVSEGEHVMVRLLAAAPIADPGLRRDAYRWLFEQAQRQDEERFGLLGCVRCGAVERWWHLWRPEIQIQAQRQHEAQMRDRERRVARMTERPKVVRFK